MLELVKEIIFISAVTFLSVLAVSFVLVSLAVFIAERHIDDK